MPSPMLGLRVTVELVCFREIWGLEKFRIGLWATLNYTYTGTIGGYYYSTAIIPTRMLHDPSLL